VSLVRRIAAHPLVESRDFRLLFISDVLVTVAERCFVLTFSWWLLFRADAGAGRLSLLLGLESLPAIAVGVLGGPLIDRWDRKWVLLGSAILQGIIASGVFVLLVSNRLSFPLLCVAGVLLGSLIPVFDGAASAALSQTVSDNRLAAAATTQASTLEFSNIFAAALSATFLAVSGFAAAILMNVALYLASALLLGRLRSVPSASMTSDRSYMASLKDGFAEVVARRGLAAFVVVYVVKLLILVSLLVFIPMLVQSVFGAAVRWVAILETSFSLAAIVTALTLNLNESVDHIYQHYAWALALLGALMLILSTMTNPFGMVVTIAFMGACVAGLLASSNVLFQLAVSDAMKGRFFGILDTLAAAVTPIGYALVGVVSGVAHVQGVLTVNGVGLMVLGLIVLFIPRLTIRSIGTGSTRALA
jgi:MFS family permease